MQKHGKMTTQETQETWSLGFNTQYMYWTKSTAPRNIRLHRFRPWATYYITGQRMLGHEWLHILLYHCYPKSTIPASMHLVEYNIWNWHTKNWASIRILHQAVQSCQSWSRLWFYGYLSKVSDCASRGICADCCEFAWCLFPSSLAPMLLQEQRTATSEYNVSKNPRIHAVVGNQSTALVRNV